MTDTSDSGVILAVLRAVPNLNVWDGYVRDSDESDKVIRADLPYVVFYSLIPSAPELGDSLAGTSGAYLTDFQISYVGATREQAEWAANKSRAVLDRKFLTFAKGPRFVRLTDDVQGPRRDDSWTRSDGGPLFNGADRYSVAI